MINRRPRLITLAQIHSLGRKNRALSVRYLRVGDVFPGSVPGGLSTLEGGTVRCCDATL